MDSLQKEKTRTQWPSDVLDRRVSIAAGLLPKVTHAHGTPRDKPFLHFQMRCARLRLRPPSALALQNVPKLTDGKRPPLLFPHSPSPAPNCDADPSPARNQKQAARRGAQRSRVSTQKHHPRDFQPMSSLRQRLQEETERKKKKKKKLPPRSLFVAESSPNLIHFGCGTHQLTNLFILFQHHRLS